MKFNKLMVSLCLTVGIVLTSGCPTFAKENISGTNRKQNNNNTVSSISKIGDIKKIVHTSSNNSLAEKIKKFNEFQEWAKSMGVTMGIDNTDKIAYDKIDYSALTKQVISISDNNKNIDDQVKKLKASSVTSTKSNLSTTNNVSPMHVDGADYERYVVSPYSDSATLNSKGINYTINVLIRYCDYEDTLGKSIQSIDNIDSNMGQIGLSIKSYTQKDSWVQSQTSSQAVVGGRGTITYTASGFYYSVDVLYKASFFAGAGQILYKVS